MKILLLEYITGGGWAGLDLPLSLAKEGSVMAAALASDLLALPDVQLLIPWDARLPLPAYSTHERVRLFSVGDAASFRRCWARALAESDAVWPVAPETEGALEGLCRDVEQSGRLLLNSPGAAVALTGSKGSAGKRLAARGIATAPSYPLHGEPFDLPWPRVVKPDDGVGCDGVYRVDGPVHWAERCAGWEAGSLLVQPYIEGASFSLSALFCRGEALLLTVNRQLIELLDDGAFRLRGCEVNGVADEAGEYVALAGRVAKAIPELVGYAGVDFIQGPDGPVVLEINPRLTSSYAGLGQALGLNPAALVLDLFETGCLPSGLPGGGRAVSLVW